ncbi:MAG: 1,4-alpha-glucan branching protein GlgB [Acidobacteriota bacterium]
MARPATPEPNAPTSTEVLAGGAEHREALWRGAHTDPHLYLGAHAADGGSVVRALRPEARQVTLLHCVRLDARPDERDETAPASQVPPNELPMEEVPMEEVGPGLFAAFVPEVEPAQLRYRYRIDGMDGTSLEIDDPYGFPPSLTDEDLYYLGEGKHLTLWNALGAVERTLDGVRGFGFAVWAPNARRVSVVGSFCDWDGRRYPMRRLGTSGIWELFIPGLSAGALYKFEILGPWGPPRLKADPVGRWCEIPPGTASRTYASHHAWTDEEWMSAVAARDPRRAPLSAYEVHLGSWRRRSDLPFSYRELAPRLVEHVLALGFDHLELMPVAEHPYEGSWGYQVTGYFAPTARYGDPDDFRWFVDYCHRHGVGVIVDWVPAHFVRDGHGLGRFDGTALYEHEDPRRGEHPDWGTYIFNYDRWEVRNFLVANALYWFDEFHIDGLRVDAVASMLYLDYSRDEGQWLANEHGGRENFGAIQMLRDVNRAVRDQYPGRMMIAEESTAWPGVTKDPDEGGLGFTLKWNMGWMHDSLKYFAVDPLFRSHHQDQLTFAMIYEYSEAFVNPLSHDEVVHGKGSLYGKMPGDPWRKMANLRCLLGYQWTRPGKKLLFMGSELASPREWDHQAGLEWHLLDDPARRGLFDFLAALGALYQSHPCLWQADHEPDGFRWIACDDRASSVLAFARFDQAGPPTAELMADDENGESSTAPLVRLGEPAGDHLVIVLNLTPMPRQGYRIGAPGGGTYDIVLCSDDESFGGSGYPRAASVRAEPVAADGHARSLALDLPPLSILVLAPSARDSDSDSDES